MRLYSLLLTVLVISAPAAAQQPPASPSGGDASSRQDAQGADLPVSLDRIREQLSVPPDQRLRNVDVKADFSVHVQEQRRIDEMLSKLDFKSGPAPAGGLYGYDQQRMLFNPTSSPLQQPYAAYSGGEFFTIALENLLRTYLTPKVKEAWSSSRQARDEAAARQEVDQDIAAYCASRPDRDQIDLCTRPHER